ncbi:redox-sensitive transcriptional activator SoxR [Pseudahrensia aquimaris]|uniref:Redox-sensitive transcriptional activator SoxR n=1 Tax=Pseudahrensia aquimaris TaxID=744461 RepID=A0ABW3F8Z7_9HYPH
MQKNLPRYHQLTIGQIAARTGLAVSAIRFYEERGLIVAGRNSGGQRRFARADIRRLSFIMIAQQMGFSLEHIKKALAPIPLHKAPTKSQWNKLARNFRTDLDERIEALTRLRDKLEGCIGCGCLSLDTCALYNPDDTAAKRGPGPRLIIDK